MSRDKDNESKDITVIAHCLMNKPSRLSGFNAPMLKPASTGAKRQNIIQLPCPEMIYFGINRREITKDQLNHPNYRRFCNELFKPFVDMIEQFANSGMQIKIIGVPKSPSCGVELTTIGGKCGCVTDFKHEHVTGTGVFFEEIENELVRRNVLFKIEDIK
ncbi:MAG: 2-thiouracil desulfurase family protein [Methanosarcinaceae archaeon]|nr:2-thiouracil desulfurase family protein [Methanosarcinaceae archaeon]